MIILLVVFGISCIAVAIVLATIFSTKTGKSELATIATATAITTSTSKTTASIISNRIIFYLRLTT